MFGRKKERAAGTPARPAQLDQQKVMRVWQAFLDDPNPPPPGSGTPGPAPAPAPAPPVGSFGASTPAPPPPLGGGSGAGSGFAFNITPFSGSEANLAGSPGFGAGPGRALGLPGFGSPEIQRMQVAVARLEALVKELSGDDGADLQDLSLGPDQARLALARLPSVREQGRINAEQFQAVKELLESVQG